MVVGDAPTSPAVVYIAASAPCRYLIKTRVVNATESVSVPWSTDAPQFNSIKILVKMPHCASYERESFAGTPATMTATVEVAVLEDPTVMRESARLVTGRQRTRSRGRSWRHRVRRRSNTDHSVRFFRFARRAASFAASWRWPIRIIARRESDSHMDAPERIGVGVA